ncbi:hypothetical protein B566_EDAN015307 [Ephemera danica]|nr:hypothetical protein B566_EDAN015307 [Ephemera danica]
MNLSCRQTAVVSGAQCTLFLIHLCALMLEVLCSLTLYSSMNHNVKFDHSFLIILWHRSTVTKTNCYVK